ncbi:cyclin-I [Hypanus sabinus]|uniref:cyclin-I n=1 Tax=Hypanus sabinus TaxID=79690 RepID=UPI0028C37F55|nr:cyclin-I [Hypanus sabinus]
MKFSGPLESQRLPILLERAVSREAQMWKVYVPKYLTNQDTDVSPAQRDEVIQWLAELNSTFYFYPETLSLAITILDRFLALIKARPKYLRCIAISCFFLAAKTNEEDEVIPSLKDIVKNSSCGCSSADILRMERIILDKLNWDLHAVTPLDFLHIFHAMMSSRPQLLSNQLKMNPTQHIALLIRQLQQCMACHQLLQFKGSTLALAIISLKLETSIPDWLALTIDIMKKAKIDSLQLIRCRELVARHLSTFPPSQPPNAVYIYNPCKQTMVSCGRGVLRLYSSPTTEPEFIKDTTKRTGSTAAPYRCLPASSTCKQASAKRKVEEMDVDDFYDGIKRLYNEDSSQEVVGMDAVTSGCSTNLQVKEGSISPCPPLHPVTVI